MLHQELNKVIRDLYPVQYGVTVIIAIIQSTHRFSLALTAILCRGVKRTVSSTPQPAKLSAHLGDSQGGTQAAMRWIAARLDDTLFVRMYLVWQPKP